MKLHCAPEQHHMYLSAEETAAICQPLFKHSAINYFGYFRVYNSHKIVGLLTDAVWFKGFVEAGYEHQNGQQLADGFHTWADTFSEEMRAEFREKFDHDHGLYMVKNNGNHIEINVFATHAENVNINKYYMNNIQRLQHFVFYFKQRASQLLLQAQKQPIIATLQKITAANDTLFEEFFALEEYTIKQDNRLITISHREFQVLQLMAEGLSAKEIGRKLDLSHRTVETYLLSVRKKCRCHTKRDILKVIKVNNI